MLQKPQSTPAPATKANAGGPPTRHALSSGGSSLLSQQRAASSEAAAPKKAKDVSHVPCKFFRQGQCTAGTSCIFAHVLPEPGQQKQLCAYFQKGSCKFSHKCALAHIHPGQPMALDRKNKRQAQLEQQARAGASGTQGGGNLTSPPAGRNGGGRLPGISQTSPIRLNAYPSVAAPGSSSSLFSTAAPLSLATLFPARGGAPGGATSPPSNHSRPYVLGSTDPAIASFGGGANGGGSGASAAAAAASSAAPPASTLSSSATSGARAVPSFRADGAPAKVGGNGSLTFGSAGLLSESSFRWDADPGMTASFSPGRPSSSMRFAAPSTSPSFQASSPGASGRTIPGSPSAAVLAGGIGSGGQNPPPGSMTSASLRRPSFQTTHSSLSAASAGSATGSSHPSPIPGARQLAPLLSPSSLTTTGQNSPFSSSPFAAPGSRSLFLSSSYENHSLERTGSYLPPSQFAGPASYAAAAGAGRGSDGDGGGNNGSASPWRSSSRRRAEDDDRAAMSDDDEDDDGTGDGEDFLPSSLNELLTDVEMERRMLRKDSHASSPRPAHALALSSSPGTSSGGHAPPFDFGLPRGHNSVPPQMLRPSGLSTLRGGFGGPGGNGGQRSPWETNGGTDGSDSHDGRTIGRGRPGRAAAIPPSSSYFGKILTAESGGNISSPAPDDEDAPTEEASRSFKLGPSHASVAFLPSFLNERRPPPPNRAPVVSTSFFRAHSSAAAPMLTSTTTTRDSPESGRPRTPTQGEPFPSGRTPPASLSSSPSVVVVPGRPSGVRASPWGVPSLGTATNNNNPRAQHGGFPPLSTAAGRPDLVPAAGSSPGLNSALALAAQHHPGQSLPPGLGFGLTRRLHMEDRVRDLNSALGTSPPGLSSSIASSSVTRQSQTAAYPSLAVTSARNLSQSPATGRGGGNWSGVPPRSSEVLISSSMSSSSPAVGFGTAISPGSAGQGSSHQQPGIPQDDDDEIADDVLFD